MMAMNWQHNIRSLLLEFETSEHHVALPRGAKAGNVGIFDDDFWL
jgi:hypothetical protein